MLTSETHKGRSPDKRNARWTMLFIASYVVASLLDLATTDLALLLNSAAREGNVAATSNGVYDPSRAILITLGGGIVLTWMFWSGLKGAQGVDERWLDHPRQALMSLAVIPGLDRNRSRRPITLLSYAVAFVVLRVAAASNNAMIAFGTTGWIAWIVNRATAVMPNLLATILVVSALYWLIALAAAPFCARMLKGARAASEA